MRPSKRAVRGVSVVDATSLILAVPGVSEGRSYGFPAFKLGDKFLARFRDDDTVLVLKLGSFPDRDFLMARDPETFFATDHYRDHPTVLIRLASMDPTALRDVLSDAAQRIAAKPSGRKRPHRRRD